MLFGCEACLHRAAVNIVEQVDFRASPSVPRHYWFHLTNSLEWSGRRVVNDR